MGIIKINENTLDFILDNNVNNFENLSETLLLSCKTIYYINANNEYILLNDGELKLSFAVLDNNSVGFMNGFIIDVVSSSIGSTAQTLFLKPETSGVVATQSLVGKQWQILHNGVRIKGFRVVDYTFAEGQTLDTIRETLVSYIGNKIYLDKQIYGIKVNGKTLNAINEKKVKNIIYNGIIYEIVSQQGIIDTTLFVDLKDTAIVEETLSITKLDTEPTYIYIDDELVATLTTEGGGEENKVVFVPKNTQYTIRISGEGKIQFNNSNAVPMLTSITSIYKIILKDNHADAIKDVEFGGATKLEEIVFNKNLISIGKQAFLNCSALTTITFNEGLQTLGSNVLGSCTSLINITIPSSVKTIGDTCLIANANAIITFKQTENDALVFEGLPFAKPKTAVAITIQHYGNPTVLNYDYASINITPTFVDLREQQ